MNPRDTKLIPINKIDPLTLKSSELLKSLRAKGPSSPKKNPSISEVKSILMSPGSYYENAAKKKIASPVKKGLNTSINEKHGSSYLGTNLSKDSVKSQKNLHQSDQKLNKSASIDKLSSRSKTPILAGARKDSSPFAGSGTRVSTEEVKYETFNYDSKSIERADTAEDVSFNGNELDLHPHDVDPEVYKSAQKLKNYIARLSGAKPDPKNINQNRKASESSLNSSGISKKKSSSGIKLNPVEHTDEYDAAIKRNEMLKQKEVQKLENESLAHDEGNKLTSKYYETNDPSVSERTAIKRNPSANKISGVGANTARQPSISGSDIKRIDVSPNRVKDTLIKGRTAYDSSSTSIAKLQRELSEARELLAVKDAEVEQLRFQVNQHHEKISKMTSDWEKLLDLKTQINEQLSREKELIQSELDNALKRLSCLEEIFTNGDFDTSEEENYVSESLQDFSPEEIVTQLSNKIEREKNTRQAFFNKAMSIFQSPIMPINGIQAEYEERIKDQSIEIRGLKMHTLKLENKMKEISQLLSDNESRFQNVSEQNSKSIIRLEKEFAHSKEENLKLIENNQEMAEQIQQLNEELEKCRQIIDTFQTDYSGLKRQVEYFSNQDYQSLNPGQDREEIEKIKFEIEKKEQEVQESREQLRKVKEDMREALLETQAKWQKYQQNHEELVQAFKLAEVSHSKQLKEIEEERLLKTPKRFIPDPYSNDVSMTDDTDLRSEILMKDAEIRILKSNMAACQENLEKAITVHKEEKEKLTKDLDVLMRDFNKYQRIHDESLEKITRDYHVEVQSLRKELDITIIQVEENKKEYNEHIANLESQFENLKKETDIIINDSSNQIAKLNAKLLQSNTEFEVQREAKEIEIYEKVAEADQLNAENIELCQKIEKLEAQLKSSKNLEDQLNSKLKEIQQCKLEIEGYQEKIKELEERIQLNQEEFGLAKVQETKVEHEELKAKYDTLHANHEEMKTKLSSVVQDLKGDYDSNIKAMDDALKEKDNAIKTLESKLASKDNEYGTLKSQYESLESNQTELRVKYTSMVEEMRLDHESHAKLMDNLVKDKDSEISKLESQLASKFDEIETLRSQIISQVDSSYQISSHENEIKEAQDLIAAHQAELDRLRKEAQDLSVKYLNLQDSIQELIRTKDERIKDLETKQRKADSDLRIYQIKKEKEILELQELIQTQQAKIDELEQQFSESLKVRDQLKTKLLEAAGSKDTSIDLSNYVSEQPQARGELYDQMSKNYLEAQDVIKNLQQAMKLKDTELEKFRSNSDAIKEVISEIEVRDSELEQQNELLRSSYEEKMQVIIDENTNLIKELEDLKLAKQEIERLLQDKILELTKECEILKQNSFDTSGYSVTLEAQYKSQIDELQDQREGFQKTVHELTKAATDLESRYMNQIQDLSSENRVLKSELSTIKEKTEEDEEYRSVNSVLKDQLASSSKYLAEVEGNLRIAQEKISEIQKALDSNREEKQNLIKEVTDIKNKYEFLIGENVQLKQDLARIKEKADESEKLATKLQESSEKNFVSLKEIDNLRLNISNYESSASSIKSENNDLKVKIEDLTQNNLKLNEQLTKCKREIEDSIKNFTSTTFELQDKFNKASEDMRTQKIEIESLKAENTELKKENNRLISEKSVLNSIIADQDRKLQESESIIEETSKEIEKLNSAYNSADSLKGENSELKQQLEILNNEKKLMSPYLAEKDNKLQEHTKVADEIMLLSEKLREAQELNEKFKIDDYESKIQIERLTTDRDYLRASNTDLQTKLLESESLIDEISKDLQQLQLAHQLSDSKMAEARQTYQSLLAEKLEIENRLKEALIQGSDQEKYKTQIEELKNVIAYIENDNQNILDSLRITAEDKEKLVAQNEILNAKLRDVEKKLIESDAMKNEISKELEEVQSALSLCNAEVAESKINYELLLTEKMDIENKLIEAQRKLEKPLEDLNQVITKMENEIKTLEQNLKTESSSKEKVEKQVEYLNIVIESLESKILRLDENLKNETENKSNFSKQVDNMNTVVGSLENEIKKLEENLVSEKSKKEIFSKQVDQLQNVINNLENQIRNLESKEINQEDSNQKEKILTQQIEKLNSVISNLEVKIKELEGFLDNEKNSKTQELKSLKDSYDQLQREHDILSKGYHDVLQEEKALQDTKKNLQAILDETISNNTELKAEFDKANEERIILTQTLDQINNQFEKLKTESDTEKDILQNTIAESAKRHAEEIEILKEENSNLTKIIGDLNLKIDEVVSKGAPQGDDSLKKKIDEIQNENQNLEIQIRDLNKKISDQNDQLIELQSKLQSAPKAEEIEILRIESLSVSQKLSSSESQLKQKLDELEEKNKQIEAIKVKYDEMVEEDAKLRQNSVNSENPENNPSNQLLKENEDLKSKISQQAQALEDYHQEIEKYIGQITEFSTKEQEYIQQIRQLKK